MPAHGPAGSPWIVAATPVERRGAVIGKALAAAIGGALFGPAIGAIASAVGRPTLFTVLAMSGLLLTAFVRAVPDQTESSAQGVGQVLRLMHRPPMVRGLWLMALPAIVSGVLTVLAPLQLHRLGAGAAMIGATFLVGAALEAMVSPPTSAASQTGMVGCCRCVCEAWSAPRSP